MTTQVRPRVMVVGGGYAGCMAANRLAGRGAAEVTLISRDDVFVERIRLHQLAAGSGSATVGYDTILHPDITRIPAAVDRIDPDRRRLVLRDGTGSASTTELSYDLMVYAVGSGTFRTTVPGVAEHAVPIATLADAQILAQRVRSCAPGTPIAVVGGGLTGVELAAELAAVSHAAITLVSARPLVPTAGAGGRRPIARRLAALGVRVLEHTEVTAVNESTVSCVDGDILDSEITVWATGFRVPDVALRSGLACDDAGRLRVDDTLVSVDDPSIIGAGDAIAVDGIDLRMSCQSAIPLGAQAADAITALIEGRSPRRVDQGFVGQCVAVGPGRATIVPSRRDDRPFRVALSGRAGGVIKEQVCRMTVRAITHEAQRPGSYCWLRGPR